MKNLILILSAFIILLTVSCEKNNNLAPAKTTGATPASAAVKGSVSASNPTTTLYFSGTDGPNAVYWKDGTEYNLPMSDTNDNNSGPVLAYTYNMAVAGSDVYITGYNGLNFVYWKNGMSNIMPLSLYAQGLAVSGTDVYFAGICYNDNVQYNLACLKNGTYSALPRNGISAYVHATVIAGTDVYSAGADNRPNNNNNVVPVYWKNGVEHYLPVKSTAGNGVASAMSISGTDVYFAGQDGQQAAYWKNGVEYVLPMNSNVGYVSAMAISGTDVYFAGVDFRSAVYWKNGIETTLPLTSGSNYSDVTAMTADGTDIYIAGDERSVDITASTSSSIPEYWKNGTVHTLAVTNKGGGNVTGLAIAGK